MNFELPYAFLGTKYPQVFHPMSYGTLGTNERFRTLGIVAELVGTFSMLRTLTNLGVIKRSGGVSSRGIYGARGV